MVTVPNSEVIPPFEMIRLAGKDWPIPLLAPRQNRIIIPKLLALFKKMITQLPPGYQPGDRVSLDFIASIEITTEQFDDMTEVVWLALTRAHPRLGRDEFLDWPVPTAELSAALMVVLKQTGHLKLGPGDQGEVGAKNP